MSFTVRSRGGNYPHMPVELLDGLHTTMDIQQIIEPSRTLDEDAHMWDPGQTRIGCFFLPPFQRDVVWTASQQERFVESALLGLGLGTIVVVDAINCPMQSRDRFAATDRWLLDGLQRCTALGAYRRDEIAVFRGTECEHRWSDLTTNERRRISRLQIGVMKIRTEDVDKCLEIYRRLAFGGTPHAADDPQRPGPAQATRHA
jgi:hypothetical protein